MGCNTSKSGKRESIEAEKRLGQRKVLNFSERLHREWKNADKNGDGSLNFQEVKRLMKKLNVDIPERELRKEFDKYDSDGNKSLDFAEFSTMFKAVQSLPDLKALFDAACANQGLMVAEELQRFMTSSSHGKIMLSLRQCAKLIFLHEGVSEDDIAAELGVDVKEEDDEEDLERFVEEPVLTYDGFQRLMTDPNFNSAMEERKYHQVYQDMTQELSHYFISSSHNSYLLGNQLSSESSPAAISKALRSGVRVIELDAWDGPNGQPIVNHGHTMCKPTSFQGCLEAIKADGFKVSEYPVIITIENHCSLEQQKVQAELITKIFGDQLYMWPGMQKDDGKLDWTVGPSVWASPQDLMGKFVIRDKPVKKKKKGGKESSGRTNSQASKRVEGLNAEDTASELSRKSTKVDDDIILTENSISIAEDDDDDDMDDDAEDEAARLLGTDDKLLRAMYIKNVKIKSHVSKEKKKVTYQEPAYRSSSSLVEGKLLKLAKPGFQARDLAQYATRHLVRVYPAGGRVDSSNYDPVPAWCAGAQVVALNYQTNSLPVWLNQGRFSDNGGCGYILKPEFLQPLNFPDPWNADPQEVSCELTVTILSGHYLPKPLGKSEKSEVIDPYVELSLHGVDSDCKKNTTKHVDNNGFNPVWNEKFTFQCRAPEMALLSFVVNDHDRVGKDDFIGQRVIPVTSLVPGFKVIPLFFANGAPQDSYLMVRIEFSPSPPIASTDVFIGA